MELWHATIFKFNSITRSDKTEVNHPQREEKHTSLFSTNTNAWQEARISTVLAGTLLISDSKSVVSANPTTPENSY